MRNSLVRVAVVGYGYWGAHHVRVLSGIPGVEVTIVDVDSLRLADAALAYPGLRRTTDLGHVLPDVDCAVVATPPASHAEVAKYVLLAGRHALVEKPFATTVKDAEEMVATASVTGMQLMVGHTFVYHEALRRLRAVIVAGELGRIRYIDTARLGLGAYRRDVDVIWDLAPHDLYSVAYLLGESPDAVSVWEQRNLDNGRCDLAYLRLDFDRQEVSAFVNVSWLSPYKVRRITVVGDRGMAEYDYLSTEQPLRIFDVGVDFIAQDQDSVDTGPLVAYRRGAATAPSIPVHEPLVAEDVHFIDCVRENLEPRTPGRHGVENVRALAGLDLARTTRRRVRLARG